MIEQVKINILVEDSENPEKPMLWPEHGLSILVTLTIDREQVKILFDTGVSGKALLHNAKLMAVDLRDIDAIVLSHGHYDHTGGLAAALDEIEASIPIILHPDALEKKFALKPKIRFTGIPYTLLEIESKGGKILPSRNPLELAEGVIATGEIERVTSFEEPPKHYIILKNGEMTRDQMLDDQALIIRLREGLAIITGCAHAGIINTTRYAQRITGEEKVHAIIGGFHLIGASDERIEKTIQEIKRINPKIIAPCHCTGDKAINRFKEELGEKFLEIHVGSTITLKE